VWQLLDPVLKLFTRSSSVRASRVRNAGLSFLALAVGCLGYLIYNGGGPQILPVLLLGGGVGAIVCGAAYKGLNAQARAHGTDRWRH